MIATLHFKGIEDDVKLKHDVATKYQYGYKYRNGNKSGTQLFLYTVLFIRYKTQNIDCS